MPRIPGKYRQWERPGLRILGRHAVLWEDHIPGKKELLWEVPHGSYGKYRSFYRYLELQFDYRNWVVPLFLYFVFFAEDCFV